MGQKLNLDLSGTGLLGRSVVPTGTYSLEVLGCEVKETSTKNGYYLEFNYKILSGEHTGKVLTSNANISNPSEVAQRIGLSTIKTILTVGGHKNPNLLGDTKEVIGLKLNAYIVEVDTSFPGADGKEVKTTKNEFKAYFPFGEDEAPKKKAAPTQKAAMEEVPVIPSAPAVEQPAPATNKFPWQK